MFGLFLVVYIFTQFIDIFLRYRVPDWEAYLVVVSDAFSLCAAAHAVECEVTMTHSAHPGEPKPELALLAAGLGSVAVVILAIVLAVHFLFAIPALAAAIGFAAPLAVALYMKLFRRG